MCSILFLFGSGGESYYDRQSRGVKSDYRPRQANLLWGITKASVTTDYTYLEECSLFERNAEA